MNVRIAQLVSFNAGSWYDGALEMTEYSVKLWMITQSFNPEEQNIAILRAKHFIFNQIENTIFVNSVDQAKCIEFSSAGLNVTPLPGDPSDQLIGIMLFHKLNAVMEDRIKILEIEISTGTGIIYLHGENETSEELVPPNWWGSADLVHSDIEPLDSSKVLTLHQNSAWRDLDLAWPDDTDNTEPGNTVVFANFRSNDDTE